MADDGTGSVEKPYPSPLGGEKDLSLAFALAIVRTGGQALVIDEQNRSSAARRWIAVEEAVASELTFAVEPSDRLLAVDVDTEEERAWADSVRAGLAPLGCRFVLVESGRPGHCHLWILSPAGWDHEHTKAQALAVAGAPRDAGKLRSNATRPPFTPHRLGGHSKVVEPGVAGALKMFREHGAQPVPTLARSILRWLDPSKAVRSPGGRLDRGKSINRAALCMVNAGCTYLQFLEELNTQPNKVTDKYWDLPPARRAGFARQAWQDALKRVREKPAVGTNRAKVAALQAVLDQLEWAPQTARTDRPVYEALLDIAHRAAKLTIDASQRDLAERANISTRSVRAALSRLEKTGLIAHLDHENRPVHLPKAYRLRTSPPSKKHPRSPITALLRGPRAVCSNEEVFLTDIFANSPGLGRTVRQTWEALTEEPTKAADVRARHPVALSQQSILKHLHKLAAHGFAIKAGHRWAVRIPDPSELRFIAGHLGALGKGQRRIALHGRERRAMRERLGIDYAAPRPDAESDSAA